MGEIRKRDFNALGKPKKIFRDDYKYIAYFETHRDSLGKKFIIPKIVNLHSSEISMEIKRFEIAGRRVVGPTFKFAEIKAMLKDDLKKELDCLKEAHSALLKIRETDL